MSSARGSRANDAQSLDKGRLQRHLVALAIDQAAFASKNLYNAANYIIRQSFIHEGVYLCYEEMSSRMKNHEAYQALPRKVSQQVLRLLQMLMLTGHIIL